MNKNSLLRRNSSSCRQIPPIYREIKKDIGLIQALMPRKLPNMNPSLFKSLRIRTPRIPTTIHLMHSPKNDFKIKLLDCTKKSSILSIKFSGSYLLSTQIIRGNSNMIHSLPPQQTFHLVQFLDHLPLLPRIVNK